MIARVVVDPLMKKTGNKWFFITSDYAYGLGAEKAMIAELTKAGGTVVATEHIPLGTSDYSAQLTKARGSGATCVVLVLYGADLIAASKQYNEFGLKQGLGGHLNGLEMAVGIGPDNVHGIYGTPWNADVDTPASKKFIDAIKTKTGETANFRHYLGYLAAREALQGIDRAKTTDATKWVAAMEGHTFDTLKEKQGTGGSGTTRPSTTRWPSRPSPRRSGSSTTSTSRRSPPATARGSPRPWPTTPPGPSGSRTRRSSPGRGTRPRRL